MALMKTILERRIVCVAVIDHAVDAVPLAEALLAGGLDVIEVTFRTAEAGAAIGAIRKALPAMRVGAGTVLSVEQLQRALDAGVEFAVAPGLNEEVVRAAQKLKLPFFPGVLTPTEVERALGLGCKLLKFFPAESGGGVPMLKALAGPYAHTGVKFIPTGGVSPNNLADYLRQPIVGAVGGSWMAERALIAAKDWTRITALTAEAMKEVAAISFDIRYGFGITWRRKGEPDTL